MNPFTTGSRGGAPPSKAIIPAPPAELDFPAPPFEPPEPRVHEIDWPDDDVELLHFGQNPHDANSWCLQDAFEGVQIFGGTGSGKSSGSGRALARAFVASRMGGVVLTAKPDEADVWRRYMQEAADANIRPMSDLVVLSPASGFKFNFLSYAFQQGKRGNGNAAGETENLVNLFCAVLEVAEKKSGGGGGTNDSYWQRTLRQLLRNAIDLSILALGDVDLETLFTIVSTSPATVEIGALSDPEERLRASACLGLIDEAARRPLSALQRHDLDLTRTYWEREFPGLAPETRSVIVSTFTSMADCFLRGTLYDLFCTGLSAEILPERCWEQRRIIVLDLPVKEYNDIGQYGQILYKYLWQRAVERRAVSAGGRALRPVFLWADESQFFANSYDALFQSTARSSRACTVYLTQNVPSYQSVMGGSEAKAHADCFLGNLVTKIFHANGDSTTNNWASEMIGKSRNWFRQPAPGGGAAAAGPSLGESITFSVEPQTFTMLRRGGARDDGIVDAIIFQSGRVWDLRGQGQNFVQHQFRQGEGR